MLGNMKKLSPVVRCFVKKKQIWNSGLVMRRFSSAKENHEQKISKIEREKNQFIEVVTEKTYKINRYSLTPHQLWITQGKGTERPYTGEFWDNKDLGHYECVVCANKLFQSDYQFYPPTGMASFWNHIGKAVNITGDLEGVREDGENIIAEKYTHMTARVLYLDGPPPTFKRYSINSGALKFQEKPWFHPPEYHKEQKRVQKVQKETAPLDKGEDIMDKPTVNRERLRLLEEESQASFERGKKK